MRWIRKIAVMLGALVVLGLAILYGGSEWLIRRSHAMPLAHHAVPRDAASVAEGARLARVFACRDCHKNEGQGQVMFDSPAVGRVVAPAFARVVPSYTDAELIRLIRHGVRRDGAAQIIMPSEAYVHMADEDVVKIVAWLRTRKPGASDVTATRAYGPVGRGLRLAGQLPVSVVPAEQASPARRPADLGGYYAEMCQACHDLHQERQMRDAPYTAPPLAMMAAAYDDAAFRRLLRTGKGMSDRKLNMMPVVAVNAFSSFTDAEIDAIHDYLRREAEHAPPE